MTQVPTHTTSNSHFFVRLSLFPKMMWLSSHRSCILVVVLRGIHEFHRPCRPCCLKLHIIFDGYFFSLLSVTFPRRIHCFVSISPILLCHRISGYIQLLDPFTLASLLYSPFLRPTLSFFIFILMP